MRTKLILVVILVLGFVYWRGLKQATVKSGLDCEYHVVYAVCTSKGKPAALPSMLEILKAGAKF